MNEYKAIPDGYMTVGELAKKMGITVRTLQYYDKEGVLSPTTQSEGGRRLYTDKDMIKLYQILSLKSLGFSLDDIKNHIISLDTPADVANILTEQAAAIRENISNLSETLYAIEALKEEVLQIQKVDFKKYADIISNLQMKNEYYWFVKHFDDKTLDYFRSKFDKNSANAMTEKITYLFNKAIQLHNDNISPESPKGTELAKEFWDMIMEFTDGDMSMLPKLMEIGNIDGPNNKWQQKQDILGTFIEPALGAYFTSLGYNPFEHEEE